MLAVEGARLYFEIIGEGLPCLTLINGYTRPSSDFRMFAKRLEKKGVCSLLFDNRGAGKTECSRPFDRDDMVSDIVALWDHLGMDQSHVLGISMGGMLAQQLTLQHSDRVRSLSLVSTACRAAVVDEGETPWSEDPELVMKKMRPYFSETFLKKNRLLVESMVKQIAKAVATTDFVERSRSQRSAIQGFEVCDQLPTLSIPTLILHGDEDGVIALSAGEELARLIPESRLHVFPGTGHLLLAEQPVPFSENIFDFIDKH